MPRKYPSIYTVYIIIIVCTSYDNTLIVHHTIIIQVMSNGRLEEFDQPLSLLENSDSLLSKMVAKTGPVASRKLRLMAEDATRRQNSVFSLPL